MPAPLLFIGAGALLFNTGQYANQISGQRGFGGVTLPELDLSGRLPLGSGWGVSPMIAYTPFGHKSPDGGESTTVLRGGARLTRGVGFVELQAGLGMVDQLIHGAGGTTQLNNGNSVSTFGFPSGTSSAVLFYWEAGASAEVVGAVRAEAAIFATGPLSSSRTLNYSLSLSYGVL